MAYEILPCIVDTTTYEVLTFESIRELADVIKAKKEELIKKGISERYINDFIEDLETSEGAICGSSERLEAYLDILDSVKEFI